MCLLSIVLLINWLLKCGSDIILNVIGNKTPGDDNMKRLMMVLCLCVVLILTACNSTNSTNSPSSSKAATSSASEPATHDTKGTVHNVALGETFLYHRMGAVNKSVTKLEITLSDYQLIKEKSPDEGLRDQIDYVKLYALVENVGEENSHNMAIGTYSFNIYDANGREITVSTLTTQRIEPEDEFTSAELRPGGKNEGYLYISIEEGAVPAEIIYYDATNKNAAHANQFVIKL